jgi:predicted DNA-binding transcriptional regulator YafY
MRADRLVSLILLLQTRGKMTTHALADALGVSRRTILRDIDAMSLAGIPVYTDGGHGGGVALDENYRTSLTGLHESEVRALFVSSNAKLLHDIGLGDAAESTLRKLTAALPAPHLPSVEYIRQRIHIDPLWWWHDSEALPFWDELQRAVYEDWCIRAVYESYDGTVRERVLEPYSLVAKSSLWYLVARRDGELRTYRVSRFQQITVLDAHFERPADFDLATYWAAHMDDFMTSISEYAFTLRLHESRVSFVRWLVPGRSHFVPDGEWVTAHLHMESIELAKMLVFGLGADAEIIDPPELREAVLTAAHEVINHHSKDL